MSLERIEITPFALVAGEILQHRRTGELTIIRASHRRVVLYWSQGELTMAASDQSSESLAAFLVSRGAMSPEQALAIFGDDSGTAAVLRFHESGLFDLSTRQTLLREWLTSVFIPLFALDEGTAAFTDDEPLGTELRVFVQSTAALILEGIRSIANGLILRRSLGDLKREIEPASEGRLGMESVALTETEQRIAAALTERQPIEAFLKQFHTDSLPAAKVVIGMLALGLFHVVDVRSRPVESNFADTQRDLELLAAIGSGDQRSLRAVAFSRQLPSMDHYEFLKVARAATRGQILAAAETMKRNFRPADFPVAVRDEVQNVVRRIEEAVTTLQEPVRRSAYDQLLAQTAGRAGGGQSAIQQRVAQRSIAAKNLSRARQLSAEGDYYGAIVLLRQAVAYAPDLADAWFLLGSCQERNPKWRREAAESFQMALSADPNHVDALISLGDLYRSEGLIGRAQTCYEDVLKISAENQQAKSRLLALRKH